MRGRRADGVIVIGQSLHHDSLNALAAAEMPMVVWGARLPAQRRFEARERPLRDGVDIPDALHADLMALLERPA